MSLQNLKTSQSASLRAKQLKKVINQLKQKIKKIEKEGEVAPPNCHLIRYQVTHWTLDKTQFVSVIFTLIKKRLSSSAPVV